MTNLLAWGGKAGSTGNNFGASIFKQGMGDSIEESRIRPPRRVPFLDQRWRQGHLRLGQRYLIPRSNLDIFT